MKIHTKKKFNQAYNKQQAKAGKINNAAGQWVNRSSVPDNSMKRDFNPTTLGG